MKKAPTFRKLSKADCGKEISLEESHKIQLDMLDELVDFCEKNGLRYFLSGGTLLGAVRHQGFIPWDDDIDLNMPRPDCERLFQISSGKIGRYRLAKPDSGEYLNCCRWFRLYNDDTVVENYRGGTTKTHPYYHPIFVDIFPIEGLPSGKISSYLHWYRLLFLDKMQRSSSLQYMSARTIKAHIFHVLSAIPAKIVGYKAWGDMIQKCSLKFDFDTHEYVGVTTIMQYLMNEKIAKKDYLSTVKVSFEGKQYVAPGNYDIYLTQLYGDYMKLPPVEKQKSAHIFHMYWRKKKQIGG